MKKFLVLLGVILLAGGVWLAWEYRPINVDEVCRYCIEQDKETTNTDDKEKRKPDSIHQPEYLAEHFADVTAFEAWYKKINQNDKNTVLATTVAACRPDLTEIALANGGDINTRVTTYKVDRDYYIFARLRQEDDKENYDKALAELRKRPEDCNCGGPWMMNHGYNNSLLSYGIVSCNQKPWDKTVDMMEILVKNGADINKTVTVKNPEISDGPDRKYLINSNESYIAGGSHNIIITDSPLAVAIHTNNLSAIKYLLAIGADANEGIVPVLDDIYDIENDIKEERKKISEAVREGSGASWFSSYCRAYKGLKERREIYIRILNILLVDLQYTKISAETASAIYLYQNYYLRDDKDIVAKLKKLKVKPDYNSEIMKKALSDYKTNYGEAVRDLVEHGVDINSVDKRGMTALHRAALEGDADTVKFLLKHGADVNMQNGYGSTALIYIVGNTGWNIDKRSKMKIIKMLLKHGADPNIQTESGNTSLHEAMEYQEGYEEKIAKLLLKYGANVNVRNNTGKTPLFNIGSGRKDKSDDIVGLLLEYGADINIKDEEGRSALFEVMNSVNEPDVRKNIIKMFLDKGADVNMRDNAGHTLLMELFFKCDYSDGCTGSSDDDIIAEYLLEKGADINARDNEGKTVLFYATKGNHYFNAELFLKHGIDTEIKDNNSKKAFDYCTGKVCELNPQNIAHPAE